MQAFIGGQNGGRSEEMKRRKATRGEEEGKEMEKDCIVWQTPANPPERHDYIFQDGRRFVRPYFFEFISHVKNRWAGKTIVDLFADEFKGRPYEYYVSAVKCGRIRVDGEVVPVSYVVKSSQKISHFLHRHEPPVMACDVSVLLVEPDVLTVCKPPTVPVHPCGQYRKNTVVGILQAENDLAPVFPIHRLDRLVSGLLILARSAEKADHFRQQIEGGLIRKLYIAKVVGEFPENEVVINANINYNAREGRSTAEVPEPGVKAALQKGKAACTKFTRVSTNGAHSIVQCEPVTGRTHQIRVHLKHAGHPIANDVLYLSDFGSNPSTEGRYPGRGALDSCCVHERTGTNNDFDFDPMCTNCPDLAPRGYGAEEEGLWLHCVRYSGPGWTYECPYPNWASLVYTDSNVPRRDNPVVRIGA